MRTKEQIKEYYNNAYSKRDYESLNKMGIREDGQLPFYWGFLERYKPFTGQEIVLELGVGGGAILKVLSEKVKEAAGIDISEVAINIAKEWIGNKDNVYLKVTDNLNDYPNGMFDLIFEVTVFQHMLKKYVIEYLHQSHDKLKSDGLVFFQFVDDPTYSEIDKEGDENQSSWTKEEIQEQFRKAGLEIVSLNTHDITYLKPNLYSYYVLAKKVMKNG